MADVREIEAVVETADTTVTTTTETAAATSPEVRVPARTGRVLVLAWAKLTTGAATTTVTPRLRRGSGTAGTAVGDATVEAIKAAAGSSEVFSVFFTEDVDNVDTVQFTFTLQQAGATGNGTIVQAGIVVAVLQ